MVANAFPPAVNELWARIQGGLVEMKATNRGFDTALASDGSKLQIDTGGKGLFVMEADHHAERVHYVSPRSGPHHYKYNTVTGQWTDDTNGHFLFDLLTRELIYLCKGYPTW